MLEECVILLVTTIIYVLRVLSLTKKYMILSEELDKIKVNNVCDKENI
ncbi:MULTISPECIES: hypothetical protein [unclassified Clostridium]|nr:MULTISPECIES: hypothetical protein [unclassified Clostridium]